MDVLLFAFTLVAFSDANQNLDRIMSGIYAPNGVYSYMAALRNKTQGVICGGSVIRNMWIISAATCNDAMYVSVGSNDLDQQWFFKIDTKIIHPDFDNKTLLHNIMLVKTISDMPYHYYSYSYALNYYRISTLNINCDKTLDTNYTMPMAFSGWGEYTPTSSISSRLLYTNYTLVDEANCTKKNLISNQKMIFNADLQLCASTGVSSPAGTGFCLADVGGPLVWGETTLVGIASRLTNTPCETDFPGVFTKVSIYCNWISYSMSSL